MDGQFTYLVTGATGFLGRHVINELESDPQVKEILVLCRNQSTWDGYDWNKGFKKTTVIEGGVLNIQNWQSLPKLNAVNGIFHLAGLVHHSRSGSDVVYQTNVQGTLNVVKLASRLNAKVVFISTSGTVGCFRSEKDMAFEGAPFCESIIEGWPYYHSKMKAEQQAQTLADELGVNMVVVRPPVLLGPGDHRFRATGHLIRLMRGKLPFLLKGGIHFIDIRDAANAICRMMKLPNTQKVYHLAGTSCQIQDFFKMAEEESGYKAPKLVLPAKVAWALSMITSRLERFRPEAKSTILPDPVVLEMAACYWGLNSHHASGDLGYQSRDPRETIRDTVNWLRENHPDLKENSRTIQSENKRVA